MTVTEIGLRRRAFIGGSDARIIMGDDEAALLRLWRETGLSQDSSVKAPQGAGRLMRPRPERSPVRNAN
jgi:hypothetical protein